MWRGACGVADRVACVGGSGPSPPSCACSVVTGVWPPSGGGGPRASSLEERRGGVRPRGVWRAWCVWWWEEALGGGRCAAGGGDGVWGVCWSRVSPSPSRAPLPWLLSPPPPTPCRCHLPPPLVLSLHPGARHPSLRWRSRPPRSHLGAEEGGGGCPLPRTPRGRRRPPAFPSPPTPSAALLSPPTSWRPERASRSVCACRWRWGGGGYCGP